MAASGYWVIRTYVAGIIGEKIKYWVPGEKPAKSERRLHSEIRKQQQNEASAEKRMARLIHANFTSRDCLVGLDYSAEGLAALAGGDENELFQAAQRQLRLWLRRVREACGRVGIPFRYIAVTSDMDGKTGEAKRVHHHVILNREAVELALARWKLGGTHHEHLYGVADQTALAAYLLNQVRRLPDEKKYIPSRNLTVPQPRDRIAKGGAELAVPRGGQLLHRSEYKPGRPQYIRFLIPDTATRARGRAKHVRKVPTELRRR